MTKTGRTVIIIGLSLLACVAASPVLFNQSRWKGTVVKDGDVTVIRNPKEPLHKGPILELKEDLSIGGPEAPGDYAFGQIRDFIVDDDGSIYVLDLQSADIKVFDASGKYVRTIGRKGQGPGELGDPMTLSLKRASGELAVPQSRRITYFRTDGTFLRHLSLREMTTLDGRLDSRGAIYIVEGVIDEKAPRYETKKLGPDASVIAVLAKSPAPLASRKKLHFFMAVSSFQLDRADNLVYGYPLTYEILFFGPSDHKVFKKITREYDPVAITAEEKAEMKKFIKPGMNVVFDFPKSHSAYSQFFLSDLGHLFVRTWEKTKDGKSIHDIFDAEGRFIGRIPLKPSGVEILRGKYYALEQDEDGYQTIKRYALTWTAE